jgi:hypothetical protein
MNREGARRDVLPLLHLRRVGLPKAGLPSPAREPRRELDRQRGATRTKEEEAGEEGSGGRGRRSWWCGRQRFRPAAGANSLRRMRGGNRTLLEDIRSCSVYSISPLRIPVF